jgi:K+-transporting ATPase c subunit
MTRLRLILGLVLVAGLVLAGISLAAAKLKPPASLTAAAGDAEVTLSWGASGGPRLAGYRVYRRNADGTWPASALATTGKATTTYADGGLTNGTSYTYRVTAIDTATPPAESTPSNTASATPTGTAAGPCGRTVTPPASYDHVVWIVMENKAYGSIIGSASAPYTNQLAAQCGSASQFFAETHPSLPNYIAMTSGGTQGVTNDNGPSSWPLTVPSIFSQLPGAWRSLQESMTSNCQMTNTTLYAVKHNPAAYYTNVRTECASLDVPLTSTPDISARFTFVTPNLCNDTHDCTVATGDAWLSTFLGKVFASTEYAAGRTAVFLTWDEDDSSASNHIATIVAASGVVAGTVASARFDHYSMLRTTEEMLGLGFVGNAATAASMRGAFGL